MSVLATVFIAIAAAFVGFIIGFCVGFTDVPPEWKPNTKNPVQPFNTAQPVPAVRSKIVLPKYITKAEYTKRVNACLKDAVTKAVDVFVSVSDKAQKQRIINAMYKEWKAKLRDSLAYLNFDITSPRLDIIGLKTSSDKSDYSPYSLQFEAVWSLKEPYDTVRKTPSSATVIP